MTLKAVLFDLDDTLIDWSGFNGDFQQMERPHFEALHSYVSGLGYDVPPIEHLLETFYDLAEADWKNGRETMIAPHLPRILVKMFVQHDVPEDALDIDALVEAYGWDAVQGVEVFPEVPETLQTLLNAGIKIGIVTNAFQTMVMRDRELASFGILDYFKTCRFAAADVGYLKPHPVIFQKALACVGVDAANAVFVGDNLNADVVGAQRVGMKAVWRDTGYHGSRLSLGMIEPDATIESLDQIFDHLNDWFPGWRDDQ